MLGFELCATPTLLKTSHCVPVYLLSFCSTDCMLLEASKPVGGERRPLLEAALGGFKVFLCTAPEACTASAGEGHLEFQSIIRSISDVSASWCG